MTFCKAVQELGVYEQPHRSSTLVRNVLPGTPLMFDKMVHGDTIEGNNGWGQTEGNHYFWLGGTDHPTGKPNKNVQ